jgi:hypothetical protein
VRKYVLSVLVLAGVAAIVGAGPVTADSFSGRTLDGSGNNVAHPTWGQAGTQYLRVARPNYADGIGQMVSGPSPRYTSNRIFNDVGQNLFSENNISQWGWAWGQFVDHDIGLRDETPAENAAMPYDKHDPLESFSNDVGSIAFARTPAAPGTGTNSPRQQINTISSFIDGSQVYGVTQSRLDWLRNGASLLMSPDNYLPRATARGDASTAPPMDLMGPLVGAPSQAVEAGDVRANENIALTAIQTLFAREHNRIVAALPNTLSQEDKFQIARRVVGAEIQYITYSQFLPTLGVSLDPYRGYSPTVNPTLSNEFAVVGYRAHSMVHGEFDVTVPAGTYTDDQLNNVFPSEGVTVERNADGTVSLVIPLVDAFGNPGLLEQVGEGRILQSLADEHQYKNDEQMDNSLRSVLFEVPKPNGKNPPNCGQPVILPSCFTDVSDLAADDIQRSRDHGMPSYNDLRRAYGLAPVRSFTQITGESTDQFPTNDPKIDPVDPIDDPNSLDFLQLRDAQGNIIPLGSAAAQEDAVTGVRRTTLAARLKGIYGSIDKVDAFVGMVSEKHVPGTEFGPLQLAIWKKQFQALRDGDRLFYLNDPVLNTIRQTYGIDYRHSLAELIKLDAGETVQTNVFKAG